MKVLFHSLFILLFVFTACTSTPKQATIDYTQYVNPFIGTDFTGNTYPGAQVPFGMVQLSPDNGLPGWDRISGYFIPIALLPDSAIPTFLVREQATYMTSLLCPSPCLIKKQKLR